jgi:hypothetical protein
MLVADLQDPRHHRVGQECPLDARLRAPAVDRGDRVDARGAEELEAAQIEHQAAAFGGLPPHVVGELVVVRGVQVTGDGDPDRLGVELLGGQ